jgi:intein/homing endonuclease
LKRGVDCEQDVVGAFVRGFVDAEGHIDKGRNRINISQKDKRILEYIQFFLLRFGIRSSLSLEIGVKKMNYILQIILVFYINKVLSELDLLSRCKECQKVMI